MMAPLNDNAVMNIIMPPIRKTLPNKYETDNTAVVSREKERTLTWLKNIHV